MTHLSSQTETSPPVTLGCGMWALPFDLHFFFYVGKSCKCNFFQKTKQKTVSLFILWLKSFVLFEFEAACCRNSNKGNICLISSVSENVSVIFRIYPAGIFIDMWKTHTLVSVTFTTWTLCTWGKKMTGKHPVCEGSFWVDPPVKTNKLYLSSYSWQRVSDTPQERRNRKKNEDNTTIPQTLVLTTMETIFFCWCRTQSQTVVTLSWHGDTCTAAHPTPLLTRAPLWGHRSGAVMLSGACMGFFPGTAFPFLGRVAETRGGVGGLR